MRPRPLEAQPTDIYALVFGLEELIRSSVGSRVSVEVVQLAATPCKAVVDANQLESVLLNLCLNARDAMPDSGRLRIATSIAEVDEAKGIELILAPGQYLLLSVADTGTGMAAEVAAHAFEPFFTTKTAQHGTGLGLSTAFNFARQSGGHIAIESEPGRGTTMQLYLPCES